MSFQTDPLKSALEKAITELGAKKGKTFSNRIRQIVFLNLDAGRVKFFLDYHSESTPANYVIRVADHYERDHAYIKAIQIDQSPNEWETLFAEMQKIAYNVLRKKGLFPGKATFHLAVDSAADAASNLINARFPYDIDFGPWLYNFIKYACLTNHKKAAKLANKVYESLEDDETQGHIDESINGQLSGVEYLDLYLALQKLSENRRQVLELRYKEGLSFREIAQRMGKSEGAVNKLHFDAIKQLRKILDIDNTD